MSNPPPYKVDLQYDTEPKQPVELAEIRLDDALRTIKNLDHKMAELRETRETYMRQLAEALQELQKKCEVGHNTLSPAVNGQTRDLLA